MGGGGGMGCQTCYGDASHPPSPLMMGPPCPLAFPSLPAIFVTAYKDALRLKKCARRCHSPPRGSPSLFGSPAFPPRDDDVPPFLLILQSDARCGVSASFCYKRQCRPVTRPLNGTAHALLAAFFPSIATEHRGENRRSPAVGRSRSYCLAFRHTPCPARPLYVDNGARLQMMSAVRDSDTGGEKNMHYSISRDSSESSS